MHMPCTSATIAPVASGIQEENTEKVVRAIERLQAEVSSSRQWASNSTCSGC